MPKLEHTIESGKQKVILRKAVLAVTQPYQEYSVQTVDDKSVDEVRITALTPTSYDNFVKDHQKQLIEKMFKRQNPTNDLEDNNSSGCFSSWMLPLFVKVFD